MEDKKEICKSLCETLKKTREYDDLTEIAYKKREDGEEFIMAIFRDGYKIAACVTADSGAAMIRDILRAIV